MKQVLTGLFLFSLLGGCASDVPLVILEPLAANPSLADVQSDPKASMMNRRVRWGGTIVSTKSVGNKSEVEILAKAIDTDGRPELGDASLGRFLVSSDGFLDPATYSAGREVTVYGVLENVLMRNIGEHPYTYPFVQAIQLYLWPDQREYGDGTWFPQVNFGVGFGFGL